MKKRDIEHGMIKTSNHVIPCGSLEDYLKVLGHGLSFIISIPILFTLLFSSGSNKDNPLFELEKKKSLHIILYPVLFLIGSLFVILTGPFCIIILIKDWNKEKMVIKDE